MHLATSGLRRVFSAPGAKRSALLVIAFPGMLGLSVTADQVIPATTSAPKALTAPPAFRVRYALGEYPSGIEFCRMPNNEGYDCSQRRHRLAAVPTATPTPRSVPTSPAPVVRTAPTQPVTRTAPPPLPPSPPPPPPTSTQAIMNEIVAVFGPYGNQALNVARCESGFNPNAVNPTSHASGVFQFLWSTWSTTAYASQSPFNASANIHAAYQVFTRDGNSWREWSCQP